MCYFIPMRHGNLPTKAPAPRVARKGAAPKKYGYIPFRPTAQLQVDLLRTARRLNLTVSEVVRRCCDLGIPQLERKAAQ